MFWTYIRLLLVWGFKDSFCRFHKNDMLAIKKNSENGIPTTQEVKAFVYPVLSIFWSNKKQFRSKIDVNLIIENETRSDISFEKNIKRNQTKKIISEF